MLVLELNEFLQLDMRGVVCNLLVQSQKGDGRIEGLAGLGREPDDFETGRVDLLRELINGNIGRCAHEDLTRVHLREVIDDRGGSNGLACSGRSLDEAERLLEHALDCVHLRVV